MTPDMRFAALVALITLVAVSSGCGGDAFAQVQGGAPPAAQSNDIPQGSTTSANPLRYAIKNAPSAPSGATPSRGIFGNLGASQPPDRQIADIALGNRHGCLVSVAGKVYCWGDNDVGQLGFASPEPRMIPTEVPGLVNISKISAGPSATCAIRADGRVFCWGLLEFGSIMRPAEVREAGIREEAVVRGATSVEIEGSWACAVMTRGAVRCWGTMRAHPVRSRISGLPPVEELALGTGFGCGRTSSGQVWCWGDNRDGSLGDGTLRSRQRARRVRLSARVIELRARDSTVCALTHDGMVWCWGNDNGRQASGEDARVSNSPITSPHQIPLRPNVVHIALVPVGGMAMYADNSRDVWGGIRQVLSNQSDLRGTFRRLVGGFSTVFCLVTEQADAHCLGINRRGELGGGSTSDGFSIQHLDWPH